MDIEWNEWKTFLNLEPDLIGFDQILVEFHLIHAESKEDLSPYFQNLYRSAFKVINNNLFDMYCEVLEILNLNFYIFHIHANNSLPMIIVQGHTFPPLIELSFVRKDFVTKAILSMENFPVKGLDFPNKKDRPDIVNFYPWGQI